MYIKRANKAVALATFIGGPVVGVGAQKNLMSSDRKIAEYFREHQ